MKGEMFRNRQLLMAATVVLALASATVPASAGQRALSDFTSRQLTFCAVFTDQGPDCAASGYFDPETCFSKNGFNIPPPEFWTDPKTGFTAGVDSLGIEDELLFDGELGTTVTGSVSESSRPDGLADVKVTAHASNALMRHSSSTPTSTPYRCSVIS